MQVYLKYYSTALVDLLHQLYEDVTNSVQVDQPINVTDIREWHRRWLGNVYVWAGRDRSVNLGKEGFQFAASGQVPAALFAVFALFAQLAIA